MPGGLGADEDVATGGPARIAVQSPDRDPDAAAVRIQPEQRRAAAAAELPFDARRGVIDLDRLLAIRKTEVLLEIAGVGAKSGPMLPATHLAVAVNYVRRRAHHFILDGTAEAA